MQRNWLRTNDIDTNPDTWDDQDIDDIMDEISEKDILSLTAGGRFELSRGDREWCSWHKMYHAAGYLC